MKDYLESLQKQIKALRKQISQVARKHQKTVALLAEPNDMCGGIIQVYMGFMEDDMQRMAEASAKLEQLEDIHSRLIDTQKQKQK